MAKKNQGAETNALVAVDPALIDKSVEFINNAIAKTIFKGSLEIGNYLLKNFFNDDIELASSKNPHKRISFQELCRRDDLGVHPSTLSRMVRVASQERYLIDGKANVEDLTYSHKLELIKLPNDKKKLKLVEKCHKLKMSCRKLSENIFKTRQKKRGMIEPSPLKLISNVDKLIEGTQIPTLLSKPDKLESMRPKTRTKIRERTSNLLQKMTTITKECNTLITTLDDIEKKKQLEKEQKEKEERRVKREKEEKEKADGEDKKKEN